MAEFEEPSDFPDFYAPANLQNYLLHNSHFQNHLEFPQTFLDQPGAEDTPPGRLRAAQTLANISTAVAQANDLDESAAAELEGPFTRKPPLSVDQKRKNHTASEQRRRDAIRDAYKDLVDLLQTSAESHNVDLTNFDEDAEVEESDTKKRKTAGGQGRGRRGYVSAGAAKNVVLHRATKYIQHMEAENHRLRMLLAACQNGEPSATSAASLPNVNLPWLLDQPPSGHQSSALLSSMLQLDPRLRDFDLPA